MPTKALKRLAQHYENGSKKYGDNNWRKGQPLSRYTDSMIRHAFNYLDGMRDEDHLAAVAWNALSIIETEHLIAEGLLPKELDDMIKPEPVQIKTEGVSGVAGATGIVGTKVVYELKKS